MYENQIQAAGGREGGGGASYETHGGVCISRDRMVKYCCMIALNQSRRLAEDDLHQQVRLLLELQKSHCILHAFHVVQHEVERDFLSTGHQERVVYIYHTGYAPKYVEYTSDAPARE